MQGMKRYCENCKEVKGLHNNCPNLTNPNPYPVPIKTIDLSELNNKRLLVFLEDDELPNEYHQVIFNADHFKRVSDAVVSGGNISTEGMREGYEQVEVITSEKTYKLPDEFSDFE